MGLGSSLRNYSNYRIETIKGGRGSGLNDFHSAVAPIGEPLLSQSENSSD